MEIVVYFVLMEQIPALRFKKHVSQSNNICIN